MWYAYNMKTLTETEILGLLQKLELGWPRNLWLFVGDGRLSLMRKRNGERVIKPNECVDSRFIVGTFDLIEADGGGW